MATDAELAKAEWRMEILKGRKFFIEHWRELGELVAGSSSKEEAIARVRRRPFLLSEAAAQEVFCAQVDILLPSSRAALSEEIASLSAFIHSARLDDPGTPDSC